MSYLGTKPSNQTPTYKLKSEFIATSGQTVFAPSAYTPGYIDVYRNGVKLGNADFTATNGTTVTLANGATTGDLITFESVYLASIQNGIPATAGAVSASLIADNAITTAKLAPGAAASNIGTGGISQAMLASGVAGTGPAFWVYGNTNQIIASATYTKVVLNTELFDTNNNFDTTNYRFTPTVAGFYQVNAVCEAYAAGSTITAGFCNLYKNGILYSRGSAFSGSQTEYYGQISTIVYMNGTTDYLELYMYVASGGTITLYGSDFYKHFNACLIKAA